MRLTAQDLRDLNILKYYRLTRKWVCKTYGLNDADLELLIYLDCKGRFTTHERIQFREIVVVKKDGDKVNFDRDKIAKSVELALRKRPVDTDAKEKLISRIVNDVEGMGENEISSNVIGEAVMKALYTIDKVAYVRFASVYRDFRETKDFEQFLEKIDKK